MNSVVSVPTDLGVGQTAEGGQLLQHGTARERVLRDQTALGQPVHKHAHKAAAKLGLQCVSGIGVKE